MSTDQKTSKVSITRKSQVLAGAPVLYGDSSMNLSDHDLLLLPPAELPYHLGWDDYIMRALGLLDLTNIPIFNCSSSHTLIIPYPRVIPRDNPVVLVI